MEHPLDAEKGHILIEAGHTSSTKIKKAVCLLPTLIGRFFINIWQKLMQLELGSLIYRLIIYLCYKKDEYLWNSFHPLFTWCLLTYVEKIQFLFTYLTAPIALHIFYMLFLRNQLTDPSTPATHASFLPSFSNFPHPTPHWSNFNIPTFQSLSSHQWILFLLACTWAILSLVWLVLNAWYWESRCKIKGFKMRYT